MSSLGSSGVYVSLGAGQLSDSPYFPAVPQQASSPRESADEREGRLATCNDNIYVKEWRAQESTQEGVACMPVEAACH